MKKRFQSIVLIGFFGFTFSSCEVVFALLSEPEDNCDRYSIYRSRLIGEDELLWEETGCDDEREGLVERYEQKLAYYNGIYSSVHTEHVSYCNND